MHIEFCMQIDTVDSVRLVTQKAASEKMRNLSAEEIKVALVFEIDGGGIYTAMTLIN